jgi:hypothetical protein
MKKACVKKEVTNFSGKKKKKSSDIPEKLLEEPNLLEKNSD